MISSRTLPPLPFGCLRLGSDVTELQAAELRLTGEEGLALLSRDPHLAGNQQAIATVLRKTDAWVASVNLFALALQHHSDLETVLIQREHVGGICVNEGCTPTKTMIASGRVAYLARRAADYGVQTGPVTVDMGKVRQRKRDIVDSFRNRNQSRIEQTEGIARLAGARRRPGDRLYWPDNHAHRRTAAPRCGCRGSEGV